MCSVNKQFFPTECFIVLASALLAAMAEVLGNKRRHSQVSNTSGGIPLKNRFNPLLANNTDGNDEDMDLESTQNQADGAPQSKGTATKGKKPPPVIVDGTIGEGNTAIQALKGLLKENFQYKYANGKTSFYTNNEEDYKKLKEYLSEKKFQFHTFTLNSEKLVKLVLKGLPPTITIDEIKEELKDLNFNVEKIYQLSKKQEYPLYSLLFSPGTSSQEVVKIRTLCYCIVSWEKPHRKVNPTQCYRCQKFHHIANNCTRTIKCRKCAGDHHIKDCDKQDEVCANCNQKHPANSKECEIYLKVSEKRRTVQSTTPSRSQPLNHNVGQNSTSHGHWPRLASTSPLAMTNIMSGLPSSSSSSQRQPTSLHHTPVTGNDDPGSFGNILHELKSLFTGFNITKILLFAKATISKLRRATDGFSKFTIILDSICEFFDD